MANDQNCRVFLVPVHKKIDQIHIDELAKMRESLNPNQMERLLTDFALEAVKADHLEADELDQLHVLINFLRKIQTEGGG
jgi:hypothetical protein